MPGAAAQQDLGSDPSQLRQMRVVRERLLDKLAAGVVIALQQFHCRAFCIAIRLKRSSAGPGFNPRIVGASPLPQMESSPASYENGELSEGALPG